MIQFIYPLLLGRKPGTARRWLPVGVGLFVVSVVVFGGLIYLASNAPETAETVFEPVLGAAMTLIALLIIVQAFRDGGVLIAIGLASVPVLAIAVVTELLLVVGAVGFEIPLAERLEIYAVLLVPAYSIAGMGYAAGGGVSWRVRTAPTESRIWRISKTPPLPHRRNRVNAWLDSLNATGYALGILTFGALTGVLFGLIELALGTPDVSFPRLIGSGLLFALIWLGMFFLVNNERPPTSGSDGG